jgi:hypothetical protein
MYEHNKKCHPDDRYYCKEYDYEDGDEYECDYIIPGNENIEAAFEIYNCIKDHDLDGVYEADICNEL